MATLRPSPAGADPLPAVHSTDTAMAWAVHGMNRIIQKHISSPEKLMAVLTNRHLTTSGSFSGVASPEIADDMLVASAQTFLASQGMLAAEVQSTAISFEHMWAIEWDSKCAAELRAQYPNMCVFSNILDFTPARLRHCVGLDGGKELPAQVIKPLLTHCTPKRSAWCQTHSGYCCIRVCHKHVAGSPCTDASSYGDGLMFNGSQSKYFYLWCAMRRQLREPLVVHENVPRFGIAELDDVLGDLYIIIRIPLCPTQLGWRGRRPRQFCVMILKAWVYSASAGTNIPPPPRTSSMVVEHLALEECIRHIFFRTARFDYVEYMNAGEAAVVADRAWAASRKSVIARHAQTAEAVRANAEFASDDALGFFAALTLVERHRAVDFESRFGAHVAFDLSKSDKLPLKASNDNLPTLLKSVGLLFVTDAPYDFPSLGSGQGRWFIPQELLTSMGFPISRQHQQVTGVSCQFSEGHRAPPSRTHRSVSNQAGNAIHINAIGAVQMVCLLQLGGLGATVLKEDPSSSRSRGKRSRSFSDAFIVESARSCQRS